MCPFWLGKSELLFLLFFVCLFICFSLFTCLLCDLWSQCLLLQAGLLLKFCPLSFTVSLVSSFPYKQSGSESIMYVSWGSFRLFHPSVVGAKCSQIEAECSQTAAEFSVLDVDSLFGSVSCSLLSFFTNKISILPQQSLNSKLFSQRS